MPVGKELEDAQIQDLTSAAHLSIHDKALEEGATLRHGLNLLNISIDMIECLKINVMKPIVGNLTIFQAHINALTPITRFNFAEIMVKQTLC